MKVKHGFLILTDLVLCFLRGMAQQEEYACTPCKLSCDEMLYSSPGTCPHCGMPLIMKPEAGTTEKWILNEISVKEGSGAFMISGGKGKEDKTIKIYYHKPKNFQPDSRILLVIPGAGRNGDSYRDAWIKESEKYGLLILSPGYSEEEYSFGDYHMGGLMYNLDLKNSITYVENTNIALMDEKRFTFRLNPDPEAWIFKDFDRIFDLAVAATRSSQTTYDLFGHSAGGQILHRLAIFQRSSKARTILASNSGFYTLPDTEAALPFGIRGTPISNHDLEVAFQKHLVLFIGALDNEKETGGTLLRSTSADKQGVHRASRAAYFYQRSKLKAKTLGYDFNWELKMVPGIGHDHRKMGDAAASYLYEN
jgi:DNA-directed RNA polymerase subunit RPC12/RpoP